MSEACETVRVALGDRSYDILLGHSILHRAAELLAPLFDVWKNSSPRGAMIVFDERVPDHAGRLEASLTSDGWSPRRIAVPSGESSKSLQAAGAIYDEFVAAQVDRNTPVFAVGGGVVGDLAGFVAATFNRGLPMIQVPTTLLADVDSSVGGKVGINHPQAKNLIGAFHQPRGVLIDTACLSTLPPREYCSGLGEIVKYGVILDADFFAWQEAHMEALVAQEPRAVQHAIGRSCRLKADVVEHDEFERTGLRAALNYGHTYAHAFEALAGYGELLHGEAVAMGMVCASRLAERLGRIPSEITVRQIELLKRARLPVDVPLAIKLRPRELLERMRLDKKSVSGSLRFVLPSRMGAVELVEGVAEDDVLAALG